MKKSMLLGLLIMFGTFALASSVSISSSCYVGQTADPHSISAGPGVYSCYLQAQATSAGATACYTYATAVRSNGNLSATALCYGTDPAVSNSLSLTPGEAYTVTSLQTNAQCTNPTGSTYGSAYASASW